MMVTDLRAQGASLHRSDPRPRHSDGLGPYTARLLAHRRRAAPLPIPGYPHLQEQAADRTSSLQ
jgi:hypothetical protein